MLRAPLIYLSKAEWARRIITKWRVSWKVASRFVAGEKLDDAIEVVKKLNSLGINATLDHLGENVTTPGEAKVATETIVGIFAAIDNSNVRSNVSIKLTQIGLRLSADMCYENLIRICQVARDHGNFIRIDMEDSPWVDTTLRIFNKARSEFGNDHIGIVVQSYLFRSKDDINLLMQDGVRIRLCKGAYKEPKDIAYPLKKDVDSNFDLLTSLLIEWSGQLNKPILSNDGKIPPIPAIATHDPKRLEFAKKYCQEVGFPKNAIEFQMLYGIRRDLQESANQEGYPVRVYVPYGKEWYPFFVRRLAERPANLWFFVSNFFRN